MSAGDPASGPHARGAPSGWSRRGVVAGALGWAAAGLAGCSGVPADQSSRTGGVPSAAAGGATTASDGTAARLAAALVAARRAGDRGGFTALFDAGSGALADRCWGNWDALGVDAIEAEGERCVVTWGRASPAGRAVRQSVRVVPAGDRVTALAPVGRLPGWLAAPLRVRRRADAILAVAASVSEPVERAWWDALLAAGLALDAADLGSLRDPGTRLLVEVPAASDLAAVAGLTGVAATTRAATVLDAPDAAARVVGNPLSPADDGALTALLVHEGVHALTRSPLWDAPLWLVEGLAEEAAERAVPSQANRNAAQLRAAPLPTGLPAAADFTGGHQGVAYATAALAMRSAVGRWGRPAVLGWVRDPSARPGEQALVELVRRRWPS